MIPIILPNTMLEEEAIWSVQDPLERIRCSSQALFEAILPYLSSQKTLYCLVGKGLNGADTLALACLCFEAGFEVVCHLLYPHKELKAEALHFLEKAKNYNLLNSQEIPPNGSFVLIDGIFGAGFKGSIPDSFKSIFAKINGSKCTKIAIDIPSGIEGATGKGDLFIEADLTLSIGLPKWGLFVKQGRLASGHIEHVEIGLEKSIAQKKALAYLLLASVAKDLLPHEKPYFHKYQRGQVLKLAADAKFSGASILSTKAAYRTGAGLVRLIHEDHEPFFQNLCPEVTQDSVKNLQDLLAKKNTSLLMGPGLSRSSSKASLMTTLLKTGTPAVLDAGALSQINLQDLHAHLILTPHLDELKQLLKEESSDFDLLYKRASNELLKSGLTLVIKGHHSWVLHQDHKPVIAAFAPTATATAGSGDVLAGIMATYLAKGLSTFEAGCLSCAIHSQAAKIATEQQSQLAITASDIIEAISSAFDSLTL